MAKNSPTRQQDQVSELKVSGHMMALEPGLYCVFSAPDGPVADAETGLPVVRISAAPGARAGQVEVVGIDASGWIGRDAATLIRVTGASSDLLVTVYQAGGSQAENAPRIQVIRLSEPAQRVAPAMTEQAPTPAPAAAPRGEPERMEMVAHIYGRGDVGNHVGDWTGEPGSKRWIEGFGIANLANVPASDIEYQAVLGRGWLSPWAQGGDFCGSRGMSLPILGMRLRLRGASASRYRVQLRASFVDGSQVGPVADGEPCEAPSLAALEAFMIMVEPMQAAAPTAAPASAGRAARVAKAKPQPVPEPVVAAPVRRGPKVTAQTPAPAPIPATAPAPAAQAKRRTPVLEAPQPVAQPVKRGRKPNAVPVPEPVKPVKTRRS